MSSPSLTLQCRHCQGIFASPKADLSSLVRCPHCSTAAPIIEFSTIGSTTDELAGASLPTGHPFESTPQSAEGGAHFTVRGKWLQFDCPHCIRPMRLIVEDAGGLVDCAHCGLELIAPDPVLGRGARLSRASESKLGAAGRPTARDAEQGTPLGELELAPEITEAGDAETDLDPHHSLARHDPAQPAERTRAVKALDTDKLGRAFRRKEVIADQVFGSSDNDWEPTAAARQSFGESRQDKNGFWIALSIAAGIMVGIIFLIVREASRSGDVFDEAQIGAIQSAQKQRNSRFQESFAVAREALASPGWEGLLPHVRHPERVAPLMRAFYEKFPYQPIELTGFHAPVEVAARGLTLHELKATESNGKVGTLVVESSEEGAKLDWEISFNLAGFDWSNFLESRPTSVQTIRVIASRASVLDRYFEDAGIERSDGIGVRLWQGNREDLFAILPKGSELADEVSGLLEWDKGRKLIIRASFDPDSQLEDRVRLEGVVQTGWVVE